MTEYSRRDAFGLAALASGGALIPAPPATAAGAAARPSPWRRGYEGQRIADLGDGRFLNPLIGGDRPDPAILKDGAEYYMTFSSFDSYPGADDLAQPRPGQLASADGGADPQHRVGLGGQPRQA